jgi:hypothetical protein
MLMLIGATSVPTLNIRNQAGSETRFKAESEASEKISNDVCRPQGRDYAERETGNDGARKKLRSKKGERANSVGFPVLAPFVAVWRRVPPRSAP